MYGEHSVEMGLWLRLWQQDCCGAYKTGRNSSVEKLIFQDEDMSENTNVKKSYADAVKNKGIE